MILALLSGFILCLAAPWIARVLPRGAGWLCALLPASLAVYFLWSFLVVNSGHPINYAVTWIPALGLEFALRLDGLSLLFSVLVTGVGALVLIYAGGYFAGDRRLGRFLGYLLFFMASMLGVVLADNLLLLFVFWELTGISSYFLVGFDHERDRARTAALQALLVTGAGGLALLAGFLLIGAAGESYQISALLTQGTRLANADIYLPALLLILGGAFTKSAQFPFHFWLPDAMEAPTPASAYLHAATMVKAGIYVLARLHPALGGTQEWLILVTATGAVTMVIGAVMALRQTILKKLLAYTTVSALGTIVMLLGIGTTVAVAAALIFLLAHGLYKGSLFLVAGILTHATGERDLSRLTGLCRTLPITAAAAGLAALSMAGIPPLLGFISKEAIFDAVWTAPWGGGWLVAAAVLAGAAVVAAAGLAGWRPFLGKPIPTTHAPHDVPMSLWLSPLILAAAGLVSALLPGLFLGGILSAAASDVLGIKASVSPALWHGLGPALILDVAAVLGGLVFLAAWKSLQHFLARADGVAAWGGGGRWYDLSLRWLLGLARVLTRLLQCGYLRFYLLMIIITAVVLAGYPLLSEGEIRITGALDDVKAHEAALAAVLLLGTIATVRARSRLAAVATMGMVGYGAALVFVLFGGPDLAMTQVVVETLTVVLFVLALYHLPPFPSRSPPQARVRDAAVALAGGALVTTLVLAAAWSEPARPLTDFFAGQSVIAGHGRNIVNVILVDFRAFDTLGEITVLAVAGAGVFALLKLRGGRQGKGDKS